MTSPAFSSAPEPYQPAAVESQQVDTGRSVAPTEPTKSDAPKRNEVAEDERPQSYVWLANGQVVRAFNDDLPGAAGVQDPNGHWQLGDKVYVIVGVYPVETVVKG